MVRVSRDRGQLVLVAAAALAVALAPVVLAYLQLGYHADVAASADHADPAANADRYLERAVHEAAADVQGEYAWSHGVETGPAVDRVRERLDPKRGRIADARVTAGTVTRTRYNDSAARAWASDRCPRGPNRQFGDCDARRGVVVQERAGRAHVLAVALDVTVTTERGRIEMTLVVEAVDGSE
ncbi:DUF7261 family protein [Halorientalis marina]|uniref:DUF7261 family protein n=1 Tax=Halorientalis marina TaxID=2931976 RepID=UPI001FF158A4|nr:hypothetical protein [Halorientalis marina]